MINRRRLLLGGAALTLSGCKLLDDAARPDSPLRALHHFLKDLRECPGAPDLRAGDVITTGTWTDAWPIAPGERWTAAFSPPLSRLSVTFR